MLLNVHAVVDVSGNVKQGRPGAVSAEIQTGDFCGLEVG
jgi:hypothetical protein